MYALIGYPLGHSFSAEFFNEKFKNEGIEESYVLCPLISFSDFPRFILDNPGLEGFNVTIPYKQKIISCLDFVTDDVRKIGAVNVVSIIPGHKGKLGLPFQLAGFNTDCIGFRKSLEPLLNPNIRKALVLGSGGASKAVCHVLRELGILFKVVSRSPEDDEIAYGDLNEDIMTDNLLIVNTTPLGMSPKVDACPDIPYSFVSDRHVCYDLVYNPDVTKFMSLCKCRGAKVKNGLEMLHLQALAAWDIWTATSRPSLYPL